jgi:HEAT repeat protein
MHRIWTALFITAICLLAADSWGENGKERIADLVAKMPAEDSEQERQIMNALVGLGPGSVLDICKMLAPPGEVDDSQARFALHGLVIHVCRPEAGAGRQMVEAALIEALKSVSESNIQAFIIRQLELAGTETSVATLSAYLADDQLCAPAARALVEIGTDSAKESLWKALSSAQGRARETLISSLGVLGYEKAAKDILKYVESEDPATRMTALWAVAKIADPSADKVLARALEQESGLKRAKVASFYLHYAERLAEKGGKSRGAKICRKVLKRKGDYAENIQCAALNTLVLIEGKGALDDLLETMNGQATELQAGALFLADTIAGTPATQKWVKTASKALPPVRARIIEMLARRGDQAALPFIVSCLEDDANSVRLAAIAAAVRLGGDKGVDAVVAQLRQPEGADEIEMTRQSLLYCKGSYALAAVARTLPEMPAAARASFIDLLALRSAKAHVEVVFAQVEETDESVRLAALKALDDLAGPEHLPRLIDLLIQAKSSKERSAAQKAVVLVSKQGPDGPARVEPLLNVVRAADDDKKKVLLPVLSAISGRTALAEVLRETSSANDQLKETAVRTLSKWPGTEAIPALMSILANTTDQTHQVLAVRGLARLIKDGDMAPDKKVELFSQTLDGVERPEEKRLLLAGLGSVKTLASLKRVCKLLDDEAVRTEAIRAAVQIGCPADENDKGLDSYAAAVWLKRVSKFNSDVELQEKIDKHIGSIPEPQLVQKPVPDGFVQLFNGKDLTNWKGLLHSPYDNPIERAKLSSGQLAQQQAKADESMRKHWTCVDGILIFDGGGTSLATVQDYGDFELWVDWKVVYPHGDSGLYLRGSPQVQIWDPGQWNVGSGGLYNNQKNASEPTEIADNPIGYWNTFCIKMVGGRVTVHLNDKLIVDDVVLENYWDRSQAIFPIGQIELQCHGDPIHFANIFIRELTPED